MQTYEPSSPGMIVCISGGEFVKTSEAIAEIDRLKEEISELRAGKSAAVDSLYAEHRKLSTLTALIKSGEAAERAIDAGTIDFSSREDAVRAAIDDYRKMLREGL